MHAYGNKNITYFGLNKLLADFSGKLKPQKIYNSHLIFGNHIELINGALE